ncbi:NAD(P)H-binding protein [Nonomuraea sp. NPDC049152]|uniref:NAD(P)H-binding protein n=1 Tax=Nonomuraea sp. NPDC049152 TaxID=3154350 RepID=UPI0033D244BA
MILVTGATGHVGRHAVGLLLDNGSEVAAVTRNPPTANLPAEAHLVVADPSNPQTLATALNGVDAILLSPRAVGNAGTELLSLAAEHGVRRVVVLSATTVERPAGHERFAAHFKAVEDAAKASGLQWTFLRCADFAANALGWAPQIRSTGIVRGAYGDAATSPIHERDIAAVAVKALTDDDHAGRSYLLTGPQPLTQRDKVRLIGQAIGRELSFQELSPEQVRQGMLAQGMPEDVPERLLGSLADYAKQAGPSTDTVERLLSRPALTFAEWASEHADAFRPSTQS